MVHIILSAHSRHQTTISLPGPLPSYDARLVAAHLIRAQMASRAGAQRTSMAEINAACAIVRGEIGGTGAAL